MVFSRLVPWLLSAAVLAPAPGRIAGLPGAVQAGRRPAAADQEAPGRAAAEAQAVSAEELTDTPEKFLGRAVVVTASVERIWDPVLFTLDDGEALGDDERLPVLLPGRGAVSLPPIEGQAVTVTGSFHRFRAADLERFQALAAERLRRSGLVREGKPVIVATRVVTRGGLEVYPGPSTRDRR